MSHATSDRYAWTEPGVEDLGGRPFYSGSGLLAAAGADPRAQILEGARQRDGMARLISIAATSTRRTSMRSGSIQFVTQVV